MLNAILLIVAIVGVTVQNVTRKSYNRSSRGGTFTFSAASILFALLIFLITSGGRLRFTGAILPYSLVFSAAYCTAIVFAFLAIKHGSLSLSSLIIQYSLILPTVFGFILWDEAIKPGGIVGIILLLISLAMINKEEKSEKKSITPRWIIFVLLAFFGNGACSTVQKAQQLSSSAEYKNEFMILALLISLAVMTMMALITERKELSYNLKSGVLSYSICGLANGGVNLLVLLLSARMAASVMFPIISAGGIVAAYAVSTLVYKEKMSRTQTAGLIVGILSIIALNL
ncbi:MAG: hypothetical protein E7617_01635 [Ruminococcaceae bacterium]|nr:hypothetical protein [Oscillospiraceae bacterium]